MWYDDETLLTNFSKSKTEIYSRAIKEYEEKYGDKCLYITEDAYWLNGYKDPELSALRTRKGKDLTAFWRIFEQIEQEVK
jgi:hypothetical protein